MKKIIGYFILLNVVCLLCGVISLSNGDSFWLGYFSGAVLVFLALIILFTLDFAFKLIDQ